MKKSNSLERMLVTAVALVVTLALASAQGAWAIETELVPVTPTSTPFYAATVDLAAYGFVEEEYLVSGFANVYEYDPLGEVRVKTAGLPYRTRILVRRPTPHRFNGVVLIEMLNPTAGHDIDFEWQNNRELLLAEGYAWVGMTIKDVAIDFLKSWDPARYGALEMSDRGLAYDGFAQVGALLRDSSNLQNPLRDHDVDMVIGTGYSQSADYLTTFSNEFHEQALTADGRHVFDGYLHTGGNGAARPINNADLALYSDERRYNTVAAPLIRVQSETELAIFFYSTVDVRQPDSAVFRLYEIAGGSHADAELLLRTGETTARDRGIPILPECGDPLSPLEIGPVHRASLAALVRWIANGVAPPPSRWITLDANGGVARDSFGNALGGVRLPPIEVPLGTFEPGNLGTLPCPVAGSYYAFDDATLDALYPSHGRYLAKVLASALRATRDGFLLPRDAVDFVVEAALSDVGR